MPAPAPPCAPDEIRAAARWRLDLDSGWWLAAAAGAFSAVQLLFVSPHMGLSWDETVYVSQFGSHAPAAYFDAARARGVSLIAAPVAAFTSSIVILRVYLALASGLGLLGALWAWRPLRPAWVLALAGVFFGGLWTAQYYGPQVMPDDWVALSALAAVGFFLRAASPGQGSRRNALAGLAAAMAAAALLRPGDAAFLAVPLAVAALASRTGRGWQLLGCVAAGTAAGAAEWAAEACARFGGPFARLHLAGAEQGGLGFHLAVWDELRALNGPTLCRPCTIGWRYPGLSLWWLLLPVLVTLGVWAAYRMGRGGSAALATACGASVAAQYLFLIGYAAPRFLLPAYALLAIPVADCLAWLMTPSRARLRVPAIAAVAAALCVQFAAQHLVLDHQASGTVAYHDAYSRAAAGLRALGVRPPCLVKGEQFIPIAYDAGCASSTPALGEAPGNHAGPFGQPATAGQIRGALARGIPVAYLAPPGQGLPGYLAGWTRHRLPGGHGLRLVAYLPPGRQY